MILQPEKPWVYREAWIQLSDHDQRDERFHPGDHTEKSGGHLRANEFITSTGMMSTERVWNAYCLEGDEKKKHVYLYYSDSRAYGEKQEIKARIRRLKHYLNKCVGKECGPFGPEVNDHFYLHYEKDGKTLKLAEENTSAIELELSLAGYFAIVSTDKMTAREALDKYKSRDASEKLFRADKSYLGNNSMRVCSDEALASKIFIQFIALILRCRLYTELKECCEKMAKRPNYMTVPAALKELEKIVMIRERCGRRIPSGPRN